jgi:hypothetical protein
MRLVRSSEECSSHCPRMSAGHLLRYFAAGLVAHILLQMYSQLATQKRVLGCARLQLSSLSAKRWSFGCLI